MTRKLPLVLAATAMLGLSACAVQGTDPTLSRTATGAGMGALAGAAIGSFSANAGMGALIGAGAGAVGGLLWDYHQRSNQQSYQRGRTSAQQSSSSTQ
jgi:uncharacterized membrane protein